MMKKMFGDSKISLPIFILFLGLGFFIGILIPLNTEAYYPPCTELVPCYGTIFSDCTQYNFDECCNCCEAGYGSCDSPYPICANHIRFEHSIACAGSCGYSASLSWIDYCGTECEVSMSGTICTYPTGSICEDATCGSCNYQTCDVCDLCSGYKSPSPEAGCVSGTGCFMPGGSTCQCVKNVCGAECNQDGTGCPVGEVCDTNNCTCYVIAPNLQISDIEDFDTDKNVHYTIYNEGDASTETGFYCSLYVDGTYEEYKYTSSALGAGLHRDDVFSDWECTPGQTYSIKVWADDRNGTEQITESDEYDNWRTENLTCPVECTGTLSVSIIGSGTCDVTAYIYPSGCSSESYRILEEGSIKWSGTLSGDNTITRTGTVGVGSDYDYDLEFYIGGSWVWQDDDDNNECPEEEPTTCAEAGGICKANSCSTYVDCSPAAENYDCSGATPYCCLGSCTAPPEFDFNISSVIPNSGSAIQGGSTSPSTITITLISGTTQNVSLYIGSGLPSGASASFNPSSCNPTCSSSMTISTLATTPTGIYQLTVCGTTGTITHCYSYYELTVTEPGPGIYLPQVRTVPISEQGTVNTNSATFWGELTKMGGAASCLVWFEYKKSTDTVWIKTCEAEKYSTGYFACDLTGLDSNTTYDFEAFARNGGSW